MCAHLSTYLVVSSRPSFLNSALMLHMTPLDLSTKVRLSSFSLILTSCWNFAAAHCFLNAAFSPWPRSFW